MKKMTFVLMVALGLIFINFQVEAQKVLQDKGITIPESVLNTFNHKFPQATKVSWSMENPSEYEAEFTAGGRKMSANFLNDGTLKETEYKIKETALPAAIKKTLESKFKGYDVEGAEVSQTPKGTLYELNMESEETELEVVFNSKGEIIKKKVEKEDDHEENEVEK
jgi:hypothetical protein